MKISYPKIAIMTVFIFTLLADFGLIYASITNKEMFQQNYVQENTSLSLRGTALKKKWFLKVYVVALFLEENIDVDRILNESAAKKIEVVYLRRISSRKLAKESKKKLKKTLTKDQYEYVMEKLSPLDKYCPDVKKNDRYIMVYLPDSGIQFFHNDSLVFESYDKKLAQFMFASWVGERTRKKLFTKKLLGYK